MLKNSKKILCWKEVNKEGIIIVLINVIVYYRDSLVESAKYIKENGLEANVNNLMLGKIGKKGTAVKSNMKKDYSCMCVNIDGVNHAKIMNIIEENSEKKLVVGNVTHSPIVNNILTIKVGKDKKNKYVYLAVNEVEEVELKNKEDINKYADGFEKKYINYNIFNESSKEVGIKKSEEVILQDYRNQEREVENLTPGLQTVSEFLTLLRNIEVKNNKD